MENISTVFQSNLQSNVEINGLKPLTPTTLDATTEVGLGTKIVGIAPGSLESQIATGQIKEADLRLVIEEHQGSYIYKTINRLTGETVAQYPREDMIKMRDAVNYKAGKVVNAKV
ncbi:MAG: hypothetical protein CGW95_07390 [Phenylobacterium zucineum]|nr:MAG: hypothetical protein CGW95_07390 [Phenylobacterium zucineum]